MLPQQFDPGDYAILAKGKATNAVIACGTQPPRTLVTLDDGWILRMIGAIKHLFLKACFVDS
ncbi:MAG TPA: hypothetical protein DC047_20655 [Blastocatellia bacterium]|nr:hypothetical protein [Blastocatellia bacterium]